MEAQTFWLENLKLADRYNDWIFSQIQPHLGKEILEIGCGNGNFTVRLAEHAQMVVAVDLDQEYVAAAAARVANSSARVSVLQGDATAMNFSEQFDTAIMLDVLEHIEDDVQILTSLRQCLKPQGKIVIKVPALAWLHGAMDEAINHYRRYDKQTLTAVLTAAGFENCQTWYFNFAGIPGWWLNSKVLKRTTPPTSQVGFFNTVVPLFKAIEDTIQPPVGLSVYAVASKS